MEKQLNLQLGILIENSLFTIKEVTLICVLYVPHNTTTYENSLFTIKEDTIKEDTLTCVLYVPHNTTTYIYTKIYS